MVSSRLVRWHYSFCWPWPRKISYYLFWWWFGRYILRGPWNWHSARTCSAFASTESSLRRHCQDMPPRCLCVTDIPHNVLAWFPHWLGLTRDMIHMDKIRYICHLYDIHVTYTLSHVTASTRGVRFKTTETSIRSTARFASMHESKIPSPKPKYGIPC